MAARSSKDESFAAIHGNHLCGIYGSDAGRLELIVPFLLEAWRRRVSVSSLLQWPRRNLY